MRSTFFGLNTLLRALQAQQQALDTTNHNIANAGTDGYSRQTVKLTPSTPYTSVANNKPFGASLQLGTGVLVAEIRRERDIFLDLELRRQSHQAAQWETTASGLTEVEAVCDRVIIINKGQIVADQPTAELQKGSGNKQIITVEFDKEASKSALKNISGVNEVKHIRDNTWQLSASAANDIRPAIFQFAVSHQLTVLTLHKEEQRLEDVFKELTAK